MVSRCRNLCFCTLDMAYCTFLMLASCCCTGCFLIYYPSHGMTCFQNVSRFSLTAKITGTFLCTILFTTCFFCYFPVTPLMIHLRNGSFFPVITDTAHFYFHSAFCMCCLLPCRIFFCFHIIMFSFCTLLNLHFPRAERRCIEADRLAIFIQCIGNCFSIML